MATTSIKTPSLDYTGKVILVTGGGSGIGEAACRLLGAAGASVIVADRRGEAAERVAAELRDAVHVQVDVSDPGECRAMVDLARSRFGRLDGAFNNAGITEASVLGEEPIPETHLLPLEVWRRVLAVDLEGVFFCLQAELSLMLESGGGAIVNATSLQAHITFPRTAAYTAAKHGVLGLTRTVAKEYGSRGIRCNAVSPGVVDTPLTAEVIHREDFREMLLAPIPLKRFATPAEVASATVWLLSDQAGYINGTVIAADGGYLT